MSIITRAGELADDVRQFANPIDRTHKAHFAWRDEVCALLPQLALRLIALEAENERMATRIGALDALLVQHRCNVDGRSTVGECVRAGQCGCSAGLLVDKEALAPPPPAPR